MEANKDPDPIDVANACSGATSNECEFEIGQEVCHKASRERAIVVYIETACERHSQVQHLSNNMAILQGKERPFGNCELMYTGRVTLSLGFTSEEITVDDTLIEAVDT